LYAGFFGNAVALSDWFHGRFERHFGNRFSPYISFDPEFSRKKLEQALREEAGDRLLLGRDARTGGDIYFYMGGIAKWGGYVSLGYWFEVDVRNRNPISAAIGSEIQDSRRSMHDDTEDFKLTERLELPERNAQRLILSTMITAATRALSEGEYDARAKDKLRLFLSDLRKANS
jgi:hypothetical protein